MAADQDRHAVLRGLLAHALEPCGAVGAGLLKVDVRHALGAERVKDRRRVAPAQG